MKTYLRKVPVILGDFNEIWIFLTNFRTKKVKYKNSIKIPQVGAEFFSTGGRTDRHDEANSRSSKFQERAW